LTLQLVSVSRGEQERGKIFARTLAQKLAFGCLSQEDVAELAIEDGIAVGKLETAVVKKRHLTERQILEKEHYLAFITKVLCERAGEGNLVFHGRAGHLAVPGLTHVLRIRTQIETETHVEEVIQRLSIERDRAREYVERVEEDITRWVRTMYSISGDPWAGYDLALNLDRVDIGGATTTLCGFVQLPEFQATPATDNVLDNLLLAARVRIALARDERTWAARFSVRSDAGHVTISYHPHDMAVGVKAPDVVEKLSGVKDLTCSVASSNILWVQERFEAEGPTFEAVVKAATHWHSAVELMKVIPVSAGAQLVDAEDGGAVEKAARPAPLFTARQVDGGIEADVHTTSDGADGDRDLRKMFGVLNARGIAGSASRLPADMRRIRSAVNRSTPYSLVVVDEVFLDQAHATRMRRTRELVGRLGEVIQAPVVTAEDLDQFVHTRPSVYLRTVALAFVVVGATLLVFSHEKEVLEFFSPASATAKVIAAVALLLAVPLFAVIYGTLTTSVLKFFHVE
jgi:cytidylate kinase